MKFTDEEKAAIKSLSVKGGWDKKDAEPIKRKIKDHFLSQPPVTCCYCRLGMHGWHRMTIDIEHILPKSLFPDHTFTPINLNLSCKRCNMEIKGNDVSFFTAPAVPDDLFQSGNYSILHPNLDPSDDLILITTGYGKAIIMKYWQNPQSMKAKRTYEYFELYKIEITNMDVAQGMKRIESLLSPEQAQEAAPLLDKVENG